MSVLFLDFDGVIRVQLDDSEEIGFCHERMRQLSILVQRAGAKVVVSSDWRNMEERGAIAALLKPYLCEHLHEDWMTPVCGHRWNEIERWLGRHPEVKNYVVLDDFPRHFDGCSAAMRERLVLCNNRHGLVPKLYPRILEILRGTGNGEAL